MSVMKFAAAAAAAPRLPPSQLSASTVVLTPSPQPPRPAAPVAEELSVTGLPMPLSLVPLYFAVIVEPLASRYAMSPLAGVFVVRLVPRPVYVPATRLNHSRPVE